MRANSPPPQVVGVAVDAFCGLRVQMNRGFPQRGAGTIISVSSCKSNCSVLWDAGDIEHGLYIGQYQIFSLAELQQRADVPAPHPDACAPAPQAVPPSRGDDTLDLYELVALRQAQGALTTEKMKNEIESDPSMVGFQPTREPGASSEAHSQGPAVCRMSTLGRPQKSTFSEDHLLATDGRRQMYQDSAWFDEGENNRGRTVLRNLAAVIEEDQLDSTRQQLSARSSQNAVTPSDFSSHYDEHNRSRSPRRRQEAQSVQLASLYSSPYNEHSRNISPYRNMVGETETTTNRASVSPQRAPNNMQPMEPTRGRCANYFPPRYQTVHLSLSPATRGSGCRGKGHFHGKPRSLSPVKSALTSAGSDQHAFGFSVLNNVIETVSPYSSGYRRLKPGDCILGFYDAQVVWFFF